MMDKTVFLAYRRATGRHYARRIFDYLRDHDYDVFFDSYSIGAGDFEKQIFDAVRERTYFVVLLSPGDTERMSQPGDWLRREIETAFASQRRIVPILIRNFNDDELRRVGAIFPELLQLQFLIIPDEEIYFEPALERLRIRFLGDTLTENVTVKPRRSLPHVFISYSHDDTSLMQQIGSTLTAGKLNIWTDEKLQPGEPSWKRAVQQAIEGAGCVAVILSPTAKQSKWVELELDYADVHEKPIFPILARGDDKSAVPFGYTLRQRVDIRHSEHYDAEMRRLIEAICKQLGGC